MLQQITNPINNTIFFFSYQILPPSYLYVDDSLSYLKGYSTARGITKIKEITISEEKRESNLVMEDE